MRRIAVALCLIVSSAACVSLTKPEQVAECATAPGGCVNTPKQLDAGSNERASDMRALDTGTSDRGADRRNTDEPEPCIEGICYPLDSGTPGDDTGTATDDTGPVIVPDDGGPSLPDVADDTPIVVSPDGEPPPPADGPTDPPPVIVPDGPIVNPDGPIVVPDGPRDTRDAAADRSEVRDLGADVMVGICATGGSLKPAGTPCRPAAGPCDIAETCDGLNPDCPADKLEAAGKECRAAAGDCDIAETCSGLSGDCPADGFKQTGTVCRAAAGVCDYAETCPGDSATCPNDSLKQSSAVCRDATNTCDPAENCTGLSASCPQDVPPYTRPAAPTTVTASPGELQATVSWSAVAGATGYNVKRSNTAGGPYTTIATAVLASPYIDTGLDNTKTYYYVISSLNTLASCASTADSPEASVTPTGVCQKPTAPTVNATAGNGQVTLSWGTIAGATAYAIDRSESSGTGYASIAQVTAPTTTYVDQAVTFGKTYYYKVTTKAACDSDPSTEVSAAPLCSPPAAVPTGLVASTPNTGSVVVLTWNAVSGAKTSDRYYIMRKLAADTAYTKIAEVTPPAVTFSDTPVTNGTAYNYAVTYYNGTCTSGNSNIVTATAACVMDKPVLTANPGNKKVDLSWTQPPNGSLTGYEVYRKETGSYTMIKAVTGAGSTTYSDATPPLTNDTTYTYYVKAIGNCNADSDPKTATPVCTPLDKPTNLKATAGDKQVTLNWDAVAGADHYTVKRGAATGGPYTALTPASPIMTNSYTDTGLTNGTTYYYVVTVSNGTCDSANSNEANATPQTCPSQGAPGKPTLSITSSTQVKVDWTAATPQPPNGYIILRSTSATGTYASVGTAGGAAVTFTDSSSATVGNTYYYKVQAVGASCSNTSDYASITLTCSNPGKPAPTISSNSNGSMALAGTLLSSGATVYNVSRSDDDGVNYSVIASNQTAATYTDSTSHTNAKRYYYKVTATNAGGQCSVASDPVSAVSCVILSAPTGVSATRTGHNRVTVAWTNVTSAQSYYIQRSGGTNVRVTAGSPYVDTTAANGTAYSYVLSAASDTGGVCSSSNSTPAASVPSCVTRTAANDRYSPSPNSTAAFCFVTCWDFGGMGLSNMDGRTYVVNGTAQGCPNNSNCDLSQHPLPPKGNGGYAFNVTAGTYGYAEIYWWAGTARDCP
jgi:fibronectin type 3 domain-containing protein